MDRQQETLQRVVGVQFAVLAVLFCGGDGPVVFFQRIVAVTVGRVVDEVFFFGREVAGVFSAGLKINQHLTK